MFSKMIENKRKTVKFVHNDLRTVITLIELTNPSICMIFMCLIGTINMIEDAILVSLVLIFRIKTKRFYFR